MNRTSRLQRMARWVAAGAGVAAGAYATFVAITWARYGRVSPPGAGEEDPLLDRFMPAYDVVERHHVRVAADAEVTLTAATELNLSELPVVRAVFRAREWVLRAHPDDRARPVGLLAEMQSLGWGILAEIPGREFVVGAVTQPWEANVIFRSVPPDQFASFHEPGFVKIAWTLRTVPIGPRESVFHTETRAIATDASARVKFRRYWAFFSPGIMLIRRASLGPVKAEAERRTRLIADRALANISPPSMEREHHPDSAARAGY